MIKNKKTAFTIITSLILVSFVVAFPASASAEIPYPLTTSSINTSDSTMSDAFKSHFGHDIDEPYWSILYDFSGNYTEKDYNPGPYNESLQEGKYDNNTNIDTKFFIAWNNLRNIHSFYLAMDNFSWRINDNNESLYGCAPYQFFFQHFNSPLMPRHHIFVLNKFLGLLAYRDNQDGGIPDLPDESDELYIGWPQFSEYHKFLVNFLFNVSGVDPWYLINETKYGKAVPIKQTHNDTTNTYEFGMSYQDIFILWQNIQVEEGPDNVSVSHTEILDNCSAFSILSYINFTFKISIENTLLGKEVITTTEYDIGPLDSLWIIGDNETTAKYFNGTSFNITIHTDEINIGHYNSTEGIGKRLDGNSTITGFGLSVINTAHIAIVKFISYQGYQIPLAVDLNKFRNEQGDPLGDRTENVSQAGVSYMGSSYTIDFASKPTYTWYNGKHNTTYDAPTRVLKNDQFNINTSATYLDLAAISAIAILILRARGTGWDAWWAAAEVIRQLYNNQFFYLTSFPKWSGAQITQDPTFSVFVPNILPQLPEEGGGGLPWGILLPVIFIIGICSIIVIGFILWRKRRK